MDRLYLCGRDGPPPPPPPTWPGPNGLDSDRNRRWTHRFVTIERERERERELQHHSFRVIRETWPSKRCGPYNRVLLDDRWWAIGFRTGFHRNGPNFTGFLFFVTGFPIGGRRLPPFRRQRRGSFSFFFVFLMNFSIELHRSWWWRDLSPFC